MALFIPKSFGAMYCAMLNIEMGSICIPSHAI
jgi:hypothetical protein